MSNRTRILLGVAGVIGVVLLLRLSLFGQPSAGETATRLAGQRAAVETAGAPEVTVPQRAAPRQGGDPARLDPQAPAEPAEDGSPTPIQAKRRSTAGHRQARPARSGAAAAETQPEPGTVEVRSVGKAVRRP